MRAIRMLPTRPAVLLLTVLTLSLTAGWALADVEASAGDFLTGTDGNDRAAWLMQRGLLEDFALTGQMFAQDEIGAGGDSYYTAEEDGTGGGGQAGLKMLASLVLPGAGEALGGHKRGYLMMALDIFAWTRVSHYHNEGETKSDDYYKFADEHYTDARLVEGYNPGSLDPERSGEGALYINDAPEVYSEDDLHLLPLYVTKEADRREYYENLGKWDQFIFGWDDYLRPSYWGQFNDYEYTGTISDLRQPWVSKNREIYRTMRAEANDAYKTRDRWLYLNIGLRVFSVVQVAWLEGLLGGGDDEMAVLGHPVQIIAQPMGPYKGTVGASVAF